MRENWVASEEPRMHPIHLLLGIQSKHDQEPNKRKLDELPYILLAWVGQAWINYKLTVLPLNYRSAYCIYQLVYIRLELFDILGHMQDPVRIVIYGRLTQWQVSIVSMRHRNPKEKDAWCNTLPSNLELVDGIEPPSDDYKSTVLPLYYTSMLWL